MRIGLAPVGGWWMFVALAAALVLLLLVRPERSRTTARQRAILVGLRAAAVLVMLFGLLRPTLVYTQTRQQSASVILLVDASRSMRVADMLQGRTRWQTLVSELSAAAPELAKLADQFDVQVYAFDREPKRVELANGKVVLPADPQGNETAIGAALDDVLRREAGKRLAAVLLLSDGAQRARAPRDTPPQVPAGQLADLGYPLYAFCIGQTAAAGQTRDVSLADLQVNDTVFVKNQLGVGGTVGLDGLANQPARVQLLWEDQPGRMQPHATQEVRTAQNTARVPVELVYVPETPGEYKVTLRADPPRGVSEAVTSNNELSTFVTVLKGGVNVLYIEGALRAEQPYLRRAIDSSPDVKLDLVRLDAQRPETRPKDLDDWFKPGKYDVYILGDVDSDAFTPEQLKALAEAVRRGAGLIMLGGFHSFGPGGYQKTALADVLPIEMGPLERQRFGEPVAGDLHLPGPLPMQPTAAGRQHYLMLLGSADGGEGVWSKLPPLEGANRFSQLKPRANVLAVGPNQAPLLVAQDYGNGRVLAFAGDSTWRWAMRGYESAHHRFWRQVVLWLARKDQSTEGNVWVKLPRRRFAPGDRVEFLAGANSPTGEPVADSEFTAEVSLPDGKKQPQRMTPQGSQQSGAFLEANAPGDYTLTITARRGGEPLGTAKSRFLVFDQDLEMEYPAADPGTMDMLARRTGGQSLPPEQLGSLLARLRKLPQQLEIERETKTNLWDNWPFFAVLCGLLSTEWYLRKRWNLV